MYLPITSRLYFWDEPLEEARNLDPHLLSTPDFGATWEFRICEWNEALQVFHAAGVDLISRLQPSAFMEFFSSHEIWHCSQYYNKRGM